MMRKALIILLMMTAMGVLLLVSARRAEAQQPALTLYYPIAISQPNLVMSFAVVNNDTTSQSVTVELTAFNDQGTLITGTNIQNPVTKTIPSRGQIAELLNETFGSGFNNVTGWVRMTSSSTKLQGFYLLFDPALTTLDGSDVGAETPQEAVLPDVSSGLINIVNPGSTETLTRLQLRGPGGEAVATVTRVLPGHGRVFQPATLLFNRQIAADNYVSISSEAPIVPAVLFSDPFDKYLAALNGQPLSGGATRLYSPQFANGGPYSSEMCVLNMENRAGQVTLQFISNNGSQLGNTVTRNIAANGMIRIVGHTIFGLVASDQLVEGYVLIESNGPRLNGSVRFGDPQKLQFQTALPFVKELRKSVLFAQVAQGVYGFFTGTAILNPNNRAIEVLIEVFDSNGTRVSTGTRTIVPNGRVTVVLSEIDPNLQLSEGYFKITSADDFASFAVFGTNDLSVLSAIPPQLPN